MGGERHGGSSGHRRSSGALAAIALLLAACGGSSTDGSGTASGAIDPATPRAVGGDGVSSADGVDLGRFEFGRGRGSVVVAVLDGLRVGEALDSPWGPFNQAQEPIESCRFGAPEAEVSRAYINRSTGESIGVRIQIYSTPEEASAAFDQLAGDDYLACAADSLDVARSDLLAEAVYDGLEVTQPGPAEPAIVDGLDGGISRRWELSLTGGGASLDLDVITTAWVEGVAVIGAEVALSSDDHRRLTELVGDNVGWEPDAFPSDPGIDAAVERLRRSVSTEQTQARFYELIEAAVVEVSNDTVCGGPAAGRAEIFGPIWATGQGVSALIQQGVSYPTETEAAAALEAAAGVDPACLFDDRGVETLGPVTFTGGGVVDEESGGRRVVTVEVSMVQTIDSTNGVEVDVADIITFTRVGTEVLSWRFLGIRGDEPDMATLVVDAAERIETGS
ncbi:MAG: hypothetical protein AAGD35_06470 [Actinomycetota bacterium]